MSKMRTYNSTVLITGGAGFIGSNLCRVLLTKGFTVYAVDNLITGHRKNIEPLLKSERFYFSQLDITETRLVREFSDTQIDYVYHLACPTGVLNTKLLAEEMLQTCSIGTKNVLEVARSHNAKMVFTSSCEVYGQPEVFPQHEEYSGNVHPLGERSPYEEGKRFSESLIAMYVRKYNVEANIVRIFNTYGPGMSLEDTRVIPQFLKSISTDQEICIYGNGEQTRTFLYIDDLMNGLELVIEKGERGEIYNVGSHTPISMNELAKLMMRLTGRQNNVAHRPHFIEDHNNRLPAVEKIKRLAWHQTVSLEEGLRRMIGANGLRHLLVNKKPQHVLAAAGDISR